MSLTIIIPSIGRRTVQRAVDSVEAQTVKADLLVSFDQRHEGAARTRNRMVKEVKTSWVGFCDDDDWLDEHYHEWLKQTRHADMLIFQMERPDGMVLPDHTDSDKLAYNWVGISFALRTSIAKHYLFKDIIGEDFDLIQRVQRAGLRVVIDPRVAYFVGSE